VTYFALPAPGGLLFTWQIEGMPPQALVDSAPYRGFEGTFNRGQPWTAQWRGQLRVDVPGDYAFRVRVISTATVSIDGQELVRGENIGQTPLTPGWHAIRIDYVDRDPYARLFVDWRPPGARSFEPIPDAQLLPALQLPS